MGAPGKHTVHTGDRLARLRELLKSPAVNVQAFVVPSEDQHFSEYPAACDKRREFISGFNGSAGCAIVTLDKAYLFTDGRYFLQAGKQLDENWTLMKQGEPNVPTWQDFLSKNLDSSLRIGIDPTIISATDAETLTKQLSAKGSTLVSLLPNPIDNVWSDKPARPRNEAFHLDEKYAGQSHVDKVKKIREHLDKSKAKAIVVTMLDEIAWLFNLRGTDIEFNPVFFANAVVTLDKVVLFVDSTQLTQGATAYVSADAEIHPYEAFLDYLKTLSGSLELNETSKIIIGDKASLAVAEAIGSGRYTIERSVVTDLKAIKNETELEGFRQSHIRDGAALIKYFAWLEEQLKAGKELNEWQGSEQLEAFRAEQPLFKGLSFTTISSTGPNGAIIHYSPDPNDCDIIRQDQVYLCDSGGQYLDGTTDVTRTLHFGTPTTEEKRAFTRVLQGHISIDTAVFPVGTSGFTIDAFARRALWQDGLDYRHGTGHGVGHFLNVHEGPQGIGTRIAYNSVPLKPGMTLSNEPGFYEDGKFGIRLENVVLVKEVKTERNFGGKGYLGFEHVTMAPIATNLIEVSLLTSVEKDWVNEYHAEVWKKVSPLLSNDTRALGWLKRATAPI